MRWLIKLKLIVLIGLWSVICLGLYAVLALGEAVVEVGAGAAGGLVGQGAPASGLVDTLGDVAQIGLGLVWLLGVLALWFVKRLITSRETRAATARVAVKGATVAAPYVLSRHPVGRAVNAARGPAGRWLGAMLAKRMSRRLGAAGAEGPHSRRNLKRGWPAQGRP
jgi:hypothetical protein